MPTSLCRVELFVVDASVIFYFRCRGGGQHNNLILLLSLPIEDWLQAVRRRLTLDSWAALISPLYQNKLAHCDTDEIRRDNE